MTLLEEAKQLRAEFGKLRPDKRRRYSETQKARVLDWLARSEAAGGTELEASKLLGIRTWRIRTWRREAAREPVVREPVRRPEPLALVPIAITMPTTTLLVVVAPSGYRIEGLSLEQAVAALRELT